MNIGKPNQEETHETLTRPEAWGRGQGRKCLWPGKRRAIPLSKSGPVTKRIRTLSSKKKRDDLQKAVGSKRGDAPLVALPLICDLCIARRQVYCGRLVDLVVARERCIALRRLNGGCRRVVLDWRCGRQIFRRHAVPAAQRRPHRHGRRVLVVVHWQRRRRAPRQPGRHVGVEERAAGA